MPTYNKVARGVWPAGQLWARIVDFVADAAYPTGGYVIDPRQVGIGVNGVVLGVIPMGASGGFFAEYVPGTTALRIRDASGGVGAASPEVAANLAALNGVTFRLLVLGLGSPG